MLKRQDNSISRTKVLNMLGIFTGAVLSGLPMMQVSIPPMYYGILFIVFSAANQLIRSTQTKL